MLDRRSAPSALCRTAAIVASMNRRVEVERQAGNKLAATLLAMRADAVARGKAQ